MIKKSLAFFIMLLSSSAFALEVASEEDLSNASAQDGIAIKLILPSSGWRADAMGLTDNNGISASVMAGYTSPGTVIAKNVGFNTCSEGVSATCTALTTATLLLRTDSVGDSNGSVAGGGAMLNIGVSLIGGANKIRLFIDDIRLRNGSSGTSEKIIIDFLQNYVDIVPIGSSSLFTVQLGNETLGHLLHFTNGNFGTIDFGTVALIDGTTSTNSVRFGFKLDEFNITDAGIDVSSNGVVFTDANFGKGLMDVTFSDVRMGGASAASMGTFGINNISVTGLEVTLAGKN